MSLGGLGVYAKLESLEFGKGTHFKFNRYSVDAKLCFSGVVVSASTAKFDLSVDSLLDSEALVTIHFSEDNFICNADEINLGIIGRMEVNTHSSEFCQKNDRTHVSLNITVCLPETEYSDFELLFARSVKIDPLFQKIDASETLLKREIDGNTSEFYIRRIYFAIENDV